MIKRTIDSKIERLVRTRPSVLITGPRQVGKTTIARTFVDRGFSYVSLESGTLRDEAKEDPIGFLSVHPDPLIVDEVQKAPNLFDALFARINERKYETGNNRGMYILTGSQSFETMKGVSESMSGRVAIVEVLPLSRSEILGRDEIPLTDWDIALMEKRARETPLDKKSAYEAIVRGSYPELFDTDGDELLTNEFYQSYVDTFLEKDVRGTLGIRSEATFRSFLRSLASMSGQELVLLNACRSVGIDLNTGREWLNVLIGCGLVFLLHPYNPTSVNKTLSRRSKIHFVDTGLAASLAHLSSSDTLRVSYFSGAYFESFVVSEIRKALLNSSSNAELYYYRDSSGNEIDLVVLVDGKLIPIEIKSSSSIDRSWAKGFALLEKGPYQAMPGYVVSLAPNVTRLNERGTYVIPAAAL